MVMLRLNRKASLRFSVSFSAIAPLFVLYLVDIQYIKQRGPTFQIAQRADLTKN